MTSGWTGGQYSVFRALLGAYLCAHFLTLAPWGAELFSDRGMVPRAATSPLVRAFPNVLAVLDSPAFVVGLILAAAAASVLLAAGHHDRLAAVGIWYVWACLLGRNPLITNPGIPYVGWILLAHALLPAAPYGSVAARGRNDPRAGWRMSPTLFAGAWALMAVGYTYSGVTKLGSPSWLDGSAVEAVLRNPLARPGTLRDLLLALPDPVLRMATWATLGAELCFAPLALLRHLRPWLWAVGLSLHLVLIALVDFADLSLGMVMLHLFTFDPAWVPARRAGGPEIVFYDGQCGLCHAAVRFVVSEEAQGAAAPFKFAPLGGAAFRAAIPASTSLPDSVVVFTDEGRVLARSAAVLHVGGRLGGLWRLLALAAARLPEPFLDWAYDRVASARRRFPPPPEACPIPSAALRSRLLA